jgi:hypothetical protein
MGFTTSLQHHLQIQGMDNLNCVINVANEVLPFYIFKGEKLQDDYIKKCEPRNYIVL